MSPVPPAARLPIVFPLLLAVLGGCARPEEAVTLRLRNPHPEPWPDAPVALALERHPLPDSLVRVYRLAAGRREELASQLDDLDGDRRPDVLFFLVDLPAGGEATVEIRPSPDRPGYPARSSAFLAVREGGRFEEGVYLGGSGFTPRDSVEVPPEQAEGSGWARFDGPVWESDLAGYRLPLTQRHVVGVFGKRVPEPSLPAAEGDPRRLRRWGGDVLLTGRSLGLGTPAVGVDTSYQRFDHAAARTVEIVANGPLRSIVRTTYRGVGAGERVLDVVSEQEIHAGDRWTEQRLRISGDTTGLDLVTGIVRHPRAPDLHEGREAGVFFAYSFGPQSAQGHGLGLAVLVPERLDPTPQTTDPASHLIRFDPAPGGRTAYRFLAAWALEPRPIRDRAAFEAALRRTARRWMQPVEARSAE